MIRVVGWTRWSVHEGEKAPQELWPRGGQRTKTRTGVPPQGLPEPWPRAPELELEGEATLGPADSPGLVGSQAWAPQDMAGWRKEVTAPGPDRG
ncbi:hypothetical protein NDU88_004944 [Pleurodeles waltl]|uniref:Uncharacterized protein n=1 Tax=Pleurodeles waltl TaxID=8319 RepID=A0AAV7PDX9_PLEWA|nr:hypothetical protein NDU88_004944 [Pleurodeles waltl]